MEQNQEVNVMDGGDSQQPDAASNTNLDEIPARRLLHKCFILFSVLTALAAFWMAVGQVLGILVQQNGPVQYALRAYVILFCFLVILVELEWPRFTRDSPLLHCWISRGVVYVFLGVIGMQENDSAEAKNEDAENYEILSDIAKAVSYNMAGCGVVYCIMGIFCLQKLLGRLRKSYQARLERAKKRNQHETSGSVEDIEEGDGSATSDEEEKASESDCCTKNEVDCHEAKDLSDPSASDKVESKESWDPSASDNDNESVAKDENV